MVRPGSLIIGAAAFAAAHFIEVAAWGWFSPGGAHPAWFLNAGRAVAFTLLIVAVAAAVATSRSRRDTALVVAANVAAGGAIAMLAILFAVGAGNLFPVALALGVLVIALGAFLGAVPALTRRPVH